MIAVEWRNRAFHRDGALIRNAGWMLFAQVGRLVIHAGLFFLLARALGAHGFGMVAGSLALVLVLAPFSAWGNGNILIMRVSRNPEAFPVYYGNALLITVLSSSILTCLALVAAALFIPALPLELVLTLAVAELLFGRIVEISGQGFQALERLRAMAGLNLVLSACRFAAALGVTLTWQQVRPEQWGRWYLVSTAVAAGIGVAWVVTRIGRPRLAPRLAVRELRNGLYFSVSLASSSIYNDIDKTLLVRLATADAAGLYAAAYRIIGIAFLPIRSLIYAAYPRFFRIGQHGMADSLRYGRALLPLTVAGGLCASGCCFILAPLVPRILGDEYAATADAIRLLAGIPLLQSIHYIAADALSGAGYQGLRSAVQVLVACCNIALGLWLIPLYSWRGAAYASLLSDGMLAVALWLAALMLAKSSRENRSCRQQASLSGDGS